MLSADALLNAIRSKVDHPATARELMQRLRLPREQRTTLRRRLTGLVKSGELIKIRGNRYGLPDRLHLATGRVQVHPRGFGFVTPDHSVDGLNGDLYIAAANLNQAMHGDRVAARIEHQSGSGRTEGRIVQILERAAAKLVGRYEVDDVGMGFVVPFDRRLIMDVYVPSDGHADAAPGDMVEVELTRWPTATRNPAGRITAVLGDIDTRGVDTQLIIRKYGIPDMHGPEVIAEASRLGTTVRLRDRHGRTDFRQVPTVTIDGESARDFDDAVTITRLPNGNFWLGVHIADVAHYVVEGGALDVAAYDRATSVYFPDRAVHMFPSELATGLCSLKPRVDRLVQSCLMEIDGQGVVVRYELHDGIIHSDARMTYTDVDVILTGGEGAVAVRARHALLVPIFELMAELSHVLHERRRRRGSIDFDLHESQLMLDDAGRVEAIVASERNVAHGIIEEFMLVANETVAQHLSDVHVPALFRVHEAPDSLKVSDFEDFVSTLGHSLATSPDAVTPAHFQRLLGRLEGAPEEKPIAFLMLRMMQQARYDPVNLGHFGLATSSYTHFTSPIRRYPDLVVHRALRAARTDTPKANVRHDSVVDLPVMARHASEMERRAEDAERELVQWKKVRFMADKVGDEFSGYVTGVTTFGLFIQLNEHFVEGLVHISSMADDYYRFLERQYRLVGENTKKTYRLGDLVQVRLVRVDLQRRQLELALVDILEEVRRVDDGTARRSQVRPKRSAVGRKLPSVQRRRQRRRGR